VVRRGGSKRGHGRVAFCKPEGAARREGASGRERGERRNRAGNGDEFFGATEAGSGAEKSFGVGMARAAKNFGDRALLDDSPGVHDGDAVGDLRDDAEIVRDEKERKLEFAAKILQQRENLLLHGDVECGGRLVGDEHAGAGGESHGDQDALAETAGKLVGILASAEGRIGHGGASERIQNAAAEIGGGDVRLVDADGFLDLRADAKDGIERGHRLLKNHRDAAPAKSAKLRRGGGEKIRASGSGCGGVEPGFAGVARAVGSEAHQGERENRLAGAGLADDAERFAGGEREGNVVDRANPAIERGKLDREAANVEARHHRDIITARGTRGEDLRYRLRMANFECPLCKAATDTAGKTRYCPKCGWNKRQAVEQLRFSQRMFPVVIVLGLVLTALFVRNAAKQNERAYWIIVAVPAVVYAVALISVRRNLRRLESVPDLPAPAGSGAKPEAGGGAVAAGGAGAGGERAHFAPTAEDEALVRTPRPRATQLTARAKRSLGFIAFAVCTFEAILIWQLYRAWAHTHSFAAFERKEWALAGLVVLLALLPLSTWRAVGRERELVENGEVALGRVTKKWNTRDGTTIFYEFQDMRGETHKHSGMDYSRRLEIGMAVPVFYDRENAKQQVAACGALYEVRRN